MFSGHTIMLHPTTLGARNITLMKLIRFISVIIFYHKNFKMKKILMPILLLAAGVFMYSCKKNDAVKSIGETAAQGVPGSIGARDSIGKDGECLETTVNLIAGQSINAGYVSVINDGANIYVTYSTSNGYTLKETHLYVGDCALIPVNKPGNPTPGQFPYNATHNNVTTYTVTVPISAIPAGTCGCIAAHAVVQKLGATGQVVESQTGWGQGTLINLSGGNWGMKFAYCSCEEL